MLWQSNNFYNWVILKYKKTSKLKNFELKTSFLETNETDINLKKGLIKLKKLHSEQNTLKTDALITKISIKIKNKNKRKILRNLKKFSFYNKLNLDSKFRRKWRRGKKRLSVYPIKIKTNLINNVNTIVCTKKPLPRDFRSKRIRVYHGIPSKYLTKQQRKNWKKTKPKNKKVVKKRAGVIRLKIRKSEQVWSYFNLVKKERYSYKKKFLEKWNPNSPSVLKKQDKKSAVRKVLLKKILKLISKVFKKKARTLNIISKPHLLLSKKKKRQNQTNPEVYAHNLTLKLNKKLSLKLKLLKLSKSSKPILSKKEKKKLKQKQKKQIFSKVKKKPVLTPQMESRIAKKKQRRTAKQIRRVAKFKKFKSLFTKKKILYYINNKFYKVCFKRVVKNSIKQVASFLKKKKLKTIKVNRLFYKTPKLRLFTQISIPLYLQKVKKKMFKKFFLNVPNTFRLNKVTKNYSRKMRNWHTRTAYLKLHPRFNPRWEGKEKAKNYYLGRVFRFLHKHLKKNKKQISPKTLIKKKQTFKNIKRGSPFHNKIVYYLNLFYNHKTSLKLNSKFSINNYLFLNKFSLENYIQQFYLFKAQIQLNIRREENRVFFFNFRNKKLKTYRAARKTHWSYFTTKTIKAKRYQKFLDIFLKKTKQYYFQIFTYFQFKFEFSYQFWMNFNQLYQSYYKLSLSYKKILQFPIHIDFWHWLDSYSNNKQDLEFKIIRWQEKKIRIRKTFWMQQKKRIPKFFKKKIFNPEGNTNTIQYDFLTNYFVILKKFIKPTHTNLFIFKNKYLKLHGFKYNS